MQYKVCDLMGQCESLTNERICFINYDAISRVSAVFRIEKDFS